MKKKLFILSLDFALVFFIIMFFVAAVFTNELIILFIMGLALIPILTGYINTRKNYLNNWRLK